MVKAYKHYWEMSHRISTLVSKSHTPVFFKQDHISLITCHYCLWDEEKIRWSIKLSSSKCQYCANATDQYISHWHAYPTEQIHGIQYIDTIYGAVIEELVTVAPLSVINVIGWSETSSKTIQDTHPNNMKKIHLPIIDILAP